MKKIWNAIRFWLWWHFKATGLDKMNYDIFVRGVAIGKMRNQQLDNIARIDPMRFYKDPNEPTP